MASAYNMLYQRIQALIVTRDLKTDVDDEEIARIVETEIERFQRSSSIGAETFEAFSNPDDVKARMLSDLGGYAVVGEIANDPDVAELYVLDEEVIYETARGETRTWPTPANPAATLNWARRCANAAGVQLDASHPKLDGIRVVLPNGRAGRLSVSIPPRIDAAISLVLRIPQKRNATLDDLVGFGSLIRAAANLLMVLMWAPRVKILVVGPPKAGKTTVLDALLRAIPAFRYVILCEENAELAAPLLKGQKWQTSQVESLNDLMISAKVNNPELLCLGEVKGIDAWQMALAANMGCGVLAAVHADSPSMAFEHLAAAANPAVPAMSGDALRTLFYRLFDVVIFCDLDGDGENSTREITEISVIPPQQSAVAVALQPIFKREDIGEPMKLLNPALGPELVGKCNRVLRPHHLTIHDVLDGAEIHA